MTPKKKQTLNNMQKHVMHLRYRLTHYQFDGITPPASLLNELKMAELIVKVESMDTMRVTVKVSA